MSRKRYPEEFKIEAVKQVTEAGYSAYDVAERLGTTTNSLYNWIRKYGPQSSDYQKASQESDEIRRLKKDLKRVTDERDLLKKAAVDSIGHCNRYSKIPNCRGLMNETDIYARRARYCL